MLTAIDPDRCYKFSEAAKLLTSRRAGRPVHPRTLRRWRDEGRLVCIAQEVRGKRFWWVKGVELLRLEAAFRQVDPAAAAVRSPAERRRSHEAAVRYLEEIGA